MKDTSTLSIGRRWFPHPVLSLQLGVSWLVLVHSVALSTGSRPCSSRGPCRGCWPPSWAMPAAFTGRPRLA
jgi:hypothetical protein